MIDKKLKEALDLVGGRAIFQDQDQYYVLLSLKEFRKIRQEGVLGLTKQELVDKINNDIAAWKVVQEEQKLDQVSLSEVSDINEEIKYEKNPVKTRSFAKKEKLYYTIFCEHTLIKLNKKDS